MSISSTLYSGLYFAAQRARSGVTRSMIHRANSILGMSEDELESYVLGRLGTLYGESVSWNWLQNQPPVDRRDLFDRASALIQAEKPKIDVRKTSGSTGTPFRFPKDREMTAWMDAGMWAAYSWHGIHPGEPHVRYWGTPMTQGKRMITRMRDALLHRSRIGAFQISRKSVQRQFESLVRFGPTYGYGYPTLMRTFASLCQEVGLDGRFIGLRVVVSTGELLVPDVRRELRDFFGCPIIDEYGCTESGVLAFECEHGRKHCIPVAAWPEVIDDSGKPVADGTEGEVVVSDLFGHTLPLLRYRLHDRGVMSRKQCPCGRSMPTLEMKSGRVDSFIQTPRGPVYDAILAYTVPASVMRFKAIQVSPTRLDARIVAKPEESPEETILQCKRKWEDALGPGMTVEIEAVPDIALEKSGKLRYFVPL